MIVEVDGLDDPRLADYAHRTDVALKKSVDRFGEGPGLYLAESAIVLERALTAGHRPRSVLALRGRPTEQAVALVGDAVPVFSGPDALLAALEIWVEYAAAELSAVIFVDANYRGTKFVRGYFISHNP